jgi:hypothetical protein
MSVKNLDNTHKQHGNSRLTMAPIHRTLALGIFILGSFLSSKPIAMAESSAHIVVSIYPSPTTGDLVVAR